MVVELIKTLVDEPEKILKAGLILVKAYLAIIISNEMYIFLYGQYEIIDLSEINQWKDAFLSGRVLVGLLIFFVVHRVLFDLVEAIFFLPVRRGVKVLRTLRPSKKEENYLIKILNYLEIVEANFDSRSIKPGKNIWVVETFIDNPEELEYEVFQQSLIRELYNLSVLLSFIYFLALSESIHSKLISAIIITLNIGFYSLYVGTKALFEFFTEKGSKVGEAIKRSKVHNNVINILCNYRDKGIFDIVGV